MGSRRPADELSEIFGRPVDLVARVALHPMLIETVLGEARLLYAA
jgi:predicted nucleotidyltransferase